MADELIVPESTGPVYHKLWFGFFEQDDGTIQKKIPFPESDIYALIAQTEKYLTLELSKHLKKKITHVKAIHIHWEYNAATTTTNPNAKNKPFVLCFMLHVKDSHSNWILQNDIMYAMEKLKLETYIKDYTWKITAKDSGKKKKPSVFSNPKHNVNVVFLESAQNIKIPMGTLPKGLPEKDKKDTKPKVDDRIPKFDDIYTLDKELGRGAFAVVKVAHHKKTKDVFAVKITTKAEMQAFDKECLDSEIRVMKELLPRHKNVVHCFDVFDEPDYIYMVLEKVDGGELLERLVQKSTYSEFDARNVIQVVFEAVQHMHKHKIAHRDLKPANLLLTSPTDDTSIKVADFGFSKFCPTDESLTTQCGSAQHVAPEILKNVPYGTKVDMWALGVILFTILGGYPPFFDETGDNQKTFKKIVKADYTFYDPWGWDVISKDCKDLIKNLLIVDPRHRWSTEECLNCKWIKDGDANKLKETSLHSHQSKLREYDAKQKLKAAVYAVIGMNRLQDLSA